MGRFDVRTHDSVSVPWTGETNKSKDIHIVSVLQNDMSSYRFSDEEIRIMFLLPVRKILKTALEIMTVFRGL